jgi:hypothetical protein
MGMAESQSADARSTATHMTVDRLTGLDCVDNVTCTPTIGAVDVYLSGAVHVDDLTDEVPTGWSTNVTVSSGSVLTIYIE